MNLPQYVYHIHVVQVVLGAQYTVCGTQYSHRGVIQMSLRPRQFCHLFNPSALHPIYSVYSHLKVSIRISLIYCPSLLHRDRPLSLTVLPPIWPSSYFLQSYFLPSGQARQPLHRYTCIPIGTCVSYRAGLLDDPGFGECLGNGNGNVGLSPAPGLGMRSIAMNNESLLHPFRQIMPRSARQLEANEGVSE
jgi:hypothetical protein